MGRVVLTQHRCQVKIRNSFNLLFLVFISLSLYSCDSTESSTRNASEITIDYRVPAGLQAYYAGVDFSLQADELFEALAVNTISRHTNFLSYGERHEFLYDADANVDDPSKVVLIYSGELRDRREWTSPNNAYLTQTFNTEHVYPQSMLDGSAVSDLHILRVVDARINSQRSNRAFINGSGTYDLMDDFTFYPGEQWRGDVARMIMYMNLRYDEPFEDVGNLKLFLEWNAQDPVSVLEKQRNLIIEGAQGNRNPFIDNPHLATSIWGGPKAENIWDPSN